MECNLCGQNNTELLWVKKGHNVVQCRNCALVYVDPRPNQAEIKNLYNHDYYKDSEKETIIEGNLQRQRFRDQLKQIERYKDRARLLDIGCGVGYFLEIAENNGWETWGIEPSDLACSEARKKTKNIIQGNIEDAQYPENFFDVMTMWKLVEHLDNPLLTLKKIHRILKTNGMLVIETPNFASPEAKRLKEKWRHMNPSIHLYYFTPSTLSKLLKESGFSILKIEEVPSGTDLGAKLREMKLESCKHFLVKHFNYFSWVKRMLMGLKKLTGRNNFLVAYAEKRLDA